MVFWVVATRSAHKTSSAHVYKQLEVVMLWDLH